MVSCHKESIKEFNNESQVVETTNSFELQDGVIKFNSLETFLETIKKAKELGEENYYNENIKPLLGGNYKPLRPYFSDEEELRNYVKQKYLRF